MSRRLRTCLLAAGLTFLPAAARAELQIKPFGGVTFGGSTTLIDFDHQQGKPKLNLGVSSTWLGEIVGVEGDLATTAGYFSGDAGAPKTLVLRSHVATVMGNVVIAMPRRIAEYGLRPYAVVGLGGMHVGYDDNTRSLLYSNWLSAWDVGGGATGFISNNVGLTWDVRMFRTLKTEPPTSESFNLPQRLSFWRATMGFSFRL